MMRNLPVTTKNRNIISVVTGARQSLMKTLNDTPG
jgi:hypothetical protein